VILPAVRRFARRLKYSARVGFSPHGYRARVLSGEDPDAIVDQLVGAGRRRDGERRMRLAGRILERIGNEEGARRVYRELLENNAAQPVWLKYVLGARVHDVIVLDRYRIAYCPMPKNASSSIKARINYLMRGTHDVYSHRFFTNVYERSQTSELPDLRGYFSFTVVRDPVERLLSYYQKNVIEEGSLARELETNRADEIIPARPSIEEFVERLDCYIFYFDDVHHHTLPQSAYLRSALPHLSSVYRIEQTDALFEALSARTGVELAPTYLLKSTVDVKRLLPTLSVPARAKLEAFYREDYDLLGPWLEA
jgi:hypothetical protein